MDTDSLSLVRLGDAHILLTNFRLRPQGSFISIRDLEFLSVFDFALGWTVASLQTLAREPDWPAKVYSDLAEIYRRRWFS